MFGAGVASEKPALFLGDTYRVICGFPKDARRAAGYQLSRVQQGREPDDWKPLSSVAPNVREIRIHEPSGSFRVVYYAVLPEALLVLSAFQKKTRKTPKHEIERARARLADYMRRGST